jgi:hypothetical protein
MSTGRKSQSLSNKLNKEFSPCKVVIYVDIIEGQAAAGLEAACSAFTKPTLLAPSPGGVLADKLKALRKALKDALAEELKKNPSPAR